MLEIRYINLIPRKRASENFPWFPGFRICSMAKSENLEMPEINRNLSKPKNTYCQWLPLLENSKKLPIWFLSNNLATRKSKTTLKLQWKVLVDTFEHYFFFSTKQINNTLVQTNVNINKTEIEIIQSQTKKKTSLPYYVHVMRHKI